MVVSVPKLNSFHRENTGSIYISFNFCFECLGFDQIRSSVSKHVWETYFSIHYRQTYAHISFNIIGVALMLPFFFLSMELLQWVMGFFGGDPGKVVIDANGKETFPLVPAAVALAAVVAVAQRSWVAMRLPAERSPRR